MTGKKTYSLPWNAVDMWSSEGNRHHYDGHRNFEINLWTRAGNIRIKLENDIYVQVIDDLIAACVLD